MDAEGLADLEFDVRMASGGFGDTGWDGFPCMKAWRQKIGQDPDPLRALIKARKYGFSKRRRSHFHVGMFDDLPGSTGPDLGGHFDDNPIGRRLPAAMVDNDEGGSHRDFGSPFNHQ